MGIADDPRLIDQEHRGCAHFEKFFDLQVPGRHFRSAVHQDRIGGMEFIDVSFDHPGPVGDHHQDIGVEIPEFLSVKAQLRQVMIAMRSNKTDVEHQ